MMVLHLPFKDLMCLTLMRTSLVLLLVLWLKLVKDFLKVSCRFTLLFFFQAEDGIRDLYVTGVQTCALPISLDQIVDQLVPRQLLVGGVGEAAPFGPIADRFQVDVDQDGDKVVLVTERHRFHDRSEERRVGKEGRIGVLVEAVSV